MRCLRCTFREAIANRITGRYGRLHWAVLCLAALSYMHLNVMQEGVFWDPHYNRENHKDKIVRTFSEVTSQEVKNGFLKLDLSKLTFGFIMHQTHLISHIGHLWVLPVEGWKRSVIMLIISREFVELFSFEGSSQLVNVISNRSRFKSCRIPSFLL